MSSLAERVTADEEAVAHGCAAPAYPIRSVDNTLQILLMLQEQPTLRVSDIAARLGVARSTAHRLLAALVHRGFVARHPETRHYHPGPLLWEIGLTAMATLDEGSAARRHLEWLGEETGETCHLMCLEGTDVRFVAGYEGRNPVHIGTTVGTRLPAHATSGGKYLLAHLRAKTLVAMYAYAPDPLTDRTIVSLPSLGQELTAIRRRGFATSFGESDEGLAAIATGVWGPAQRPVGAIAIAAPAARVAREDVPRLLRPLRTAAARLTAELGGTVPEPAR
jgi:IclR family transcriptional regulator, acetate operon repressor